MHDFRALRFEETPVIGASLDDLDLDEVESHIDHAVRVTRYTGDAHDPIEFLLEHRSVVLVDTRPIPTVAGLLMFGRRAQRFLPHATISLAHYRGNRINSGDVQHLREYSGNLPKQIDNVVEYMIDHMRHRIMRAETSAQQIEKTQYPVLALRELTVNAIAHRDYSISESSIRVTMLRNSIEWSSPGLLPPTVTIETILDHQFARNSSLLRLLFQRNYVEKMGQGLNTVFEECSEQGLPAPAMRETTNSFIISLEGHDFTPTLTATQQQIVSLLREREPLKAAQITEELARLDAANAKSMRTVQSDLQLLVEEGVVVQQGRARATTYTLQPEFRHSAS
ncbi:MAG TPA: ATP-binding protein [Herpetosiphonaceae bacterium]